MKQSGAILALGLAWSACTPQQTHPCVVPALRPRVEADTLVRDSLPAGTVRGIVIDRESNQPMPEALIRVTPDGKVQRSDSAGRFKFTEVTVGSHTLAVLRLGWRMQPVTIRLTPESGAYSVLVLERDTVPATCVTTRAGH